MGISFDRAGHGEDRQVHGDHHRSEHAAEHDHHDRLNSRTSSINGRCRLLLHRSRRSWSNILSSAPVDSPTEIICTTMVGKIFASVNGWTSFYLRRSWCERIGYPLRSPYCRPSGRQCPSCPRSHTRREHRAHGASKTRDATLRMMSPMTGTLRIKRSNCSVPRLVAL